MQCIDKLDHRRVVDREDHFEKHPHESAQESDTLRLLQYSCFRAAAHFALPACFWASCNIRHPETSSHPARYDLSQVLMGSRTIHLPANLLDVKTLKVLLANLQALRS
eukprot:755767-Hanusia_phi.AAC.2